MSGIRATLDNVIDTSQLDWLLEIQENLKDDYGIELTLQEISDITEELGVDFNVDSPADEVYDYMKEQS